MTKIQNSETEFLTKLEKRHFEIAISQKKVTFFRIAACLVCKGPVPQGTIKKYCSQECFVKDGGVIENAPEAREDDDDQW